jgi:hypothetical protein
VNPTTLIAEEYLQIIDDIYGVYLDSSMGFASNKQRIEQSWNKVEHPNAKFIFGVGDPNLPGSYVLHSCTQDEFIKRNSKTGKNYTTLANLCIIQLYQYWEDDYRSKIAISKGMVKTDLLSDIFGDLRIFRNSIIHNKSVAFSDISKCKRLKWYNVGDAIDLDEKQIESIFIIVKQEIEGFKL